MRIPQSMKFQIVNPSHTESCVMGCTLVNETLAPQPEGVDNANVEDSREEED